MGWEWGWAPTATHVQTTAVWARDSPTHFYSRSHRKWVTFSGHFWEAQGPLSSEHDQTLWSFKAHWNITGYPFLSQIYHNMAEVIQGYFGTRQTRCNCPNINFAWPFMSKCSDLSKSFNESAMGMKWLSKVPDWRRVPDNILLIQRMDVKNSICPTSNWPWE